MLLKNNIGIAVNYLLERGAKVPTDVLVLAHRGMKQGGLYQNVANALWTAVYDAVYDYLYQKTLAVTGPRTRMRIAVSEAYQETAYIAYTDGGGEWPPDAETEQWINSETAAQLSYVDSAFQTLRDLRKEGDFEAIHEAFIRADRWSWALDGFYNAVKMAGAKGKLLTWSLGQTEKHCQTCATLDGQRHRASWYRSRDYYPKKPGAAMECGGYRCDCELSDDKGEVFSL